MRGPIPPFLHKPITNHQSLPMKSDFDHLISTHHPILVDFYVDKYKVCREMGPVLKDVKDRIGRRVKVLKIDVDKHRELADRFNIYGIPHLVIFVDGKIFWRHSGTLTAPEIVQQLEAALQSSVQEGLPKEGGIE